MCITSSNTHTHTKKNTLADKIKLLAQISIEGCGKTYMIRGKNTWFIKVLSDKAVLSKTNCCNILF